MLQRPGHATVVAYLALVLALGGGAYAALKLPKDSVKSKQIKDGKVKLVDLAAGVVPPATEPPAIAFAAGSFPTQPPASAGSNSSMNAETTIRTAGPGRLLVIGTAAPFVTCSGSGSCGISSDCTSTANRSPIRGRQPPPWPARRIRVS